MSSQTLVPLSISITSDNVCPFCYLGLRKLQKALELSPWTSPSSSSRLFRPAIRFHPFQLDPTLPNDGSSVVKKDWYTSKYSKERFDAMEQMMIGRGKEMGINFSYGGRVGNTTNSHRLVERAWDQGGEELQLKMVQTLFRGYFEEEKDIASLDYLASAAASANLFPSEQEARKFLESDEYKAKVQAGFDKARRSGISGVPFIAFQDMFAVPGAVDPEEFVKVIDRLAQEHKAGNWD